MGNCVIVGRGAQCILHQHADAFHVFIYAPRTERAERVRRRLGAHVDAEALMGSKDKERAHYVRVNFECDWVSRHLYHLMISSNVGEDAAVGTILCALNRP